MTTHQPPLTRRTVTEGSVLVLPAYPAAFLAVGLILRFQSHERTSSPAFDSAKWVMSWTPSPIHTWALVFLAIACAEISTGLLGKRRAFTWLLVAGCGVCAFWSTLLFWSAGISPFVSYTGGVWLLFAAWAHIASIRSLTRDWVMKT